MYVILAVGHPKGVNIMYITYYTRNQFILSTVFFFFLLDI